jgi:hypothetical protein
MLFESDYSLVEITKECLTKLKTSYSSEEGVLGWNEGTYITFYVVVLFAHWHCAA